MSIDAENTTGYRAKCAVCSHEWDVSAADADREADWPDVYWQSCPKCGNDETFAMTEPDTFAHLDADPCKVCSHGLRWHGHAGCQQEDCDCEGFEG